MGTKLKRLRTERGWTQADVAARSGISTVHVNRLEKDHHAPSIETLRKLATAFGLASVAELLE
jgi:transcriptional regulator with XRE-family HTH domain